MDKGEEGEGNATDWEIDVETFVILVNLFTLEGWNECLHHLHVVYCVNAPPSKGPNNIPICPTSKTKLACNRKGQKLSGSQDIRKPM